MGYQTNYHLLIYDGNNNEIEYGGWLDMVNSVNVEILKNTFNYLLINHPIIATFIIERRQYKSLCEIPDLSTFQEIMIKMCSEDGGDYGCRFDHDTYMVLISTIYNELTFIIEGTGEDTDDHWKETWKNSKRLTYQNWVSTGKKLSKWLLTKYPVIYNQFIEEYNNERNLPYNDINFRITDPSITIII
jgi:hypothetical protein